MPSVSQADKFVLEYLKRRGHPEIWKSFEKELLTANVSDL